MGHLMVPDDKVGSMAEMATGRHVRLEITLLHDGIVFTLWFEDGTDTPFYLYIDQNCMGGRFSKENKMKLHVYSRRGRKQRYKIKSVNLTRRSPVLGGI